jgi:hypothetical protein
MNQFSGRHGMLCKNITLYIIAVPFSMKNKRLASHPYENLEDWNVTSMIRVGGKVGLSKANAETA